MRQSSVDEASLAGGQVGQQEPVPGTCQDLSGSKSFLSEYRDETEEGEETYSSDVKGKGLVKIGNFSIHSKVGQESKGDQRGRCGP